MSRQKSFYNYLISTYVTMPTNKQFKMEILNYILLYIKTEFQIFIGDVIIIK